MVELPCFLFNVYLTSFSIVYIIVICKDSYLLSILPRSYYDSGEKNWREHLIKRLKYVDTLKEYLKPDVMVITNPRDMVFMCPGENCEASYYTVDSGYKILVGPGGEDTYSESERIRVGGGAQPRILLKGEGWGGRKGGRKGWPPRVSACRDAGWKRRRRARRERRRASCYACWEGRRWPWRI